jgi:PAS domain S-box-containing protein
MADPAAKQRAFRAGAKDYLVKPLDLTEFLLHVQALLETRSLNLRLRETQAGLQSQVEQRTSERDVSVAERDETQVALRDSEERLKVALEASKQGTWDIDLTTGVGTVSPRFSIMLGYDPKSHGPSVKKFYASIHREDRPAAMAVNEACLWGEARPYEVEYRLKTKSGVYRWFKSVGMVTSRDAAGRPVRFVGTLTDINERKLAEQELATSLERLRASEASIIRALSSITELRDPYTAGHQQRVAQICLAIAKRLELPDDRLRGLEVAALLHDVGKVSVPIEILSNPGLLSPAQRTLVESHVAAGYEILSPIPFPWPVAEIVLQSHERLDGSGYPNGLSGDEIVQEARILAVADTVEAMTAHRPYRAALGSANAVAELEAYRGTRYAPAVVDAYLSLRDEGLGYEAPVVDSSQLGHIS